MKRWVGIAVFVVAVLVIGGGAYALSRPAAQRAIPSTAPSGAPTVGSCWQVDPSVAAQALPWPGSSLGCTAAHTVEIFYVGQAGVDLLRRMDGAEGDDAKVDANLLYAQARRACVIQAPVYLGGAWHAAQVQVVAAWIKPSTDGFYACGVAQVDGPAATHFVSRTTPLEGALATAGPLAIDCVSRGAGGELSYVGCETPHDGEFVGSYTITPLDAPFQDAAVHNAAQKGCGDVALSFLGLSADQGRADLSAGSVGPKSASDWLGSDQTFGCYVLAGTGKLVGSVKGLGTKPLPRG
jgi:hypothetical protein